MEENENEEEIEDEISPEISEAETSDISWW